MKNLIRKVGGVFLLLVQVGVGAADLDSAEDKQSYALGVLFSHSLIQQNVKVETESFLAGVRDVLMDNDLQMTEKAIQQVIVQLQQSKTEEQTMAADETKLAGEKFLAENQTREDVVVLESGVQYRIIAAGKGPKPKSDSTVKVHYRGTLIDGTEFDSSYSRGVPTEFPINGVIQGWQEILPRMPTGAKWQVFIPPEFAYGASGTGNQIGPHAVLIFDIELLEIK